MLFLFLLTLVSVSALGWFGWRLFEQERLVETQRSQERLEQAADRTSMALRGTLAETGERLSEWEPGTGANLPMKAELLIQIRGNSLVLQPETRLLYYPQASTDLEANPSIFTQAEMFEFAQDQRAEALHIYQRLAVSPNTAIRAGALLRMARVLRSVNRKDQSIPLYEALAAMRGVNVGGVPADLAARHELCILTNTGAAQLQRDLLNGRWHLSRGQFSFYRSQASRFSGSGTALPEQSAILSDAVYQVWESRAHANLDTIWFANKPLIAMWRGSPERRSILLTRPDSFLVSKPQDVHYAIVDAEGRTLAGDRVGSARAAVRTAAESRLPWTLYFSAQDAAPGSHLNNQQRFLLLGIAVMVVFLILGTYFIARAIRRESDLARLQSDFVSAVSHEFRSPLTSMRQLSEILALGRVPSEARRQLYYETLVHETTRLQRVVESLLHFGSMEAGARKYRFEEFDASPLVRRTVGEFEKQFSGSGHHIEFGGFGLEFPIAADPDAISVALRNLLDNAVKYSPGRNTVWVNLGKERDRITIAVRDHGLGITDAEKKSIFQKFVRGSAASAGNVKGSGVGLAMVRHIVSAHGGEITVESKLGHGSTFTMLLPVSNKFPERMIPR